MANSSNLSRDMSEGGSIIMKRGREGEEGGGER